MILTYGLDPFSGGRSKRVTLMSSLNDQVLATYHPFTRMKIKY